ncbi:hypothetical protein EHS13_24555 [Paenibacillus psychroresistens]|uniref:NlpC/P60 domain-containing protein n=1 Tax=Paenibacillus psychroresistens TaxID=1778678 RepID=A0A6B8RQR2_9BACL|nr:NlpC/P60 family protein [Paenibacillus psychroresistens]QGQ97833.1 hypothetical protein EHS13_24555 [Paenibacillus psychroresistens]
MGSKFIIHRKWQQKSLILALFLCLIVQMGCTQKGNGSATQTTKANNKGIVSKILEKNKDQIKLPLVTQNGVKYVNAKKLVNTLGFQSKWDAKNGRLLMGDKDPNFVLKMNSREAQKDGGKIKLAAAPIIINQSAYIPLSAIGDLFRQDMKYVVNDSDLIVQANPEHSNISIKSLNGSHLDFADDPNDPNKPIKPTSATSTNDRSVTRKVIDKDSISVLANINIPSLISKAKQYIGVRYEFGADPYPQSGTFDCSSFTQYIFGQQGISLNRLARDQADQGITIGRQDLRVGDLLFFNIPGRFRSSTVPTHVGIYLGNLEMINADTRPKQGVQITDINKQLWKDAYLFAKRVAD